LVSASDDRSIQVFDISHGKLVSLSHHSVHFAWFHARPSVDRLLFILSYCVPLRSLMLLVFFHPLVLLAFSFTPSRVLSARGVLTLPVLGRLTGTIHSKKYGVDLIRYTHCTSAVLCASKNGWDGGCFRLSVCGAVCFSSSFSSSFCRLRLSLSLSLSACLTRSLSLSTLYSLLFLSLSLLSLYSLYSLSRGV
jgi:hypothetical protein